MGALAAGPFGRRVGDRTMLAGAVVVTAGVLLAVVSPWAGLQATGTFVLGIGLYLVWVDLQARTLTLRPGRAGATGSLVDVISQPGALPTSARWNTKYVFRRAEVRPSGGGLPGLLDRLGHGFGHRLAGRGLRLDVGDREVALGAVGGVDVDGRALGVAAL